MAGSITAAYRWAIDTCADPNVGYNQSYRNAQKVNGVTYYDCSSFIYFALVAGGFDLNAKPANAWTTYTMPSRLPSLGFTKYTVTSDFVWKPGDIGLSSGHTEMCYKGGTGSAIFMGAHGRNGVALANQVSIGDRYGNATGTNTFPYCWRLNDDSVKLDSALHKIAAICGNFACESNINPGIWESLKVVNWTDTWSDYSGGYGLGQWTNTNGDNHGRLYQLHEWLVANGYAVDSMEGQAKYIVQEQYWSYAPDASPTFKSLKEFLNSNSTDLELLTKEWNYYWEGINDGTLPKRVAWAQKIYNYIVEHANDTTLHDYYKGNNFLTEEQILVNSVWFYRTFVNLISDIYIPVNVTETKKKKMPVWMMVRRKK